MGLQAQFIQFNNKIYLKKTDSRLEEVRGKRDRINSVVKARFKENGWGDVSIFLQGSYATDLSIVPLDGDYDIDVAVVIPYDTAPDSPITLKKEMLSILQDRGLSDATIKRPCVTAQYLSDGKPKFHIDYPIYRCTGNHYELAWGKPTSAEKDKKWSSGDPRGLVDWTDYSTLDVDEKRQYKRMVRFLKRWRDLRYVSTEVKPYSVGLTILIRQNFVDSFSDDGEADDLSALISTIDRIMGCSAFVSLGDNKYDLVVSLPTSPYVDVFKDHGNGMGTKLYNRLGQLKNRLLAAQSKSTVVAASKILSEGNVFGSDFPVPDGGHDGNSSSNRSATKTAGAVGSPQGA
ncbi:nucleotidyltransferase [Gilvimarinus agarilyticus]|uniref:nucleotidyltransferase domain-containing protein n=1 Tax=Gilvimarinus sp. 2_MG-2023 TaxID=3062666 RepID=UPI001C089C5D|nr:nucleotidyltransferase [Gilvimarinus sp. 2_MG-2023]MBU2886288.1 nucleotidyltransferase [Gilvimarinus agarilyticus]MDO6570974.1 nucleotidyltransferase [Gilvimarinus sp. 2_MG-2023]